MTPINPETRDILIKLAAIEAAILPKYAALDFIPDVINQQAWLNIPGQATNNDFQSDEDHMEFTETRIWNIFLMTGAVGTGVPGERWREAMDAIGSVLTGFVSHPNLFGANITRILPLGDSGLGTQEVAGVKFAGIQFNLQIQRKVMVHYATIE